MSHLRFRVKLNKGKRGISLEKLEKIVSETRKFLSSIGEDLDLGSPADWVGVDFRNGSLSFTNESANSVNEAQIDRFNASVLALARSEFPATARETTALQFFKVAASLDPEEKINIAIFPNDGAKPKWLPITRRTAILAQPTGPLPTRDAVGSIQGTIHSLYKESRESFFYLRELSSGNLIKCFYKTDDYPAIWRGLQVRNQILHIHGLIVTNTYSKTIRDVHVDSIIPAENFAFDDVEKFMSAGKPQ